MKQPISPRVTLVVLCVVAVAIVIAAFEYLKPSIGAGPPVVPVPYKKPADFHGLSSPEVPIGAPGEPSPSGNR